MARAKPALEAEHRLVSGLGGRDFYSLAEGEAARELEALGFLRQELDARAGERPRAAAAARADLANAAAAHLEHDAFELEGQRDRELERAQQHLLREDLDLRVMRGRDRVLGEGEEDGLLGRMLRDVPVFLQLLVLLPAAEEHAQEVHLEDLADLGLDLLADGRPIDSGQLVDGPLELGAGLAPLDGLPRILRAGEEEIPDGQPVVTHRISAPP